MRTLLISVSILSIVAIILVPVLVPVVTILITVLTAILIAVISVLAITLTLPGVGMIIVLIVRFAPLWVGVPPRAILRISSLLSISALGISVVTLTGSTSSPS